MTLATKSLPAEISSFEDFVERALSFDFYTDQSDDNSVYLAGRRRREIMDRYAADNPIAGKLWKALCEQNLERFMVCQLMPRVEAVVLDEHVHSPAIKHLADFVIPYLCTCGKETLLGQSVRDAIAKKIGAPPSYARAQKEEREAQIDEWILGYGRAKAREI